MFLSSWVLMGMLILFVARLMHKFVTSVMYGTTSVTRRYANIIDNMQKRASPFGRLQLSLQWQNI